MKVILKKAITKTYKWVNWCLQGWFLYGHMSIRYFWRFLILIVFMAILTSGEAKSCGCLWTDFSTSWVSLSIRSLLRANSKLSTLFTSSGAASSDLDFSRSGRGWLRSMLLRPKCSRPPTSPETTGFTVCMWTGLSHLTWIGFCKRESVVMKLQKRRIH